MIQILNQKYNKKENECDENEMANIDKEILILDNNEIK